MNTFPKRFATGLVIVLSLILVLEGCSSKSLTRAQGEKALKVLDSDLNRLLTAAGESDWKKAISSLAALPEAPFPKMRRLPSDTARPRWAGQGSWAFRRGCYRWNFERKAFDFEPHSKANITIDYPLVGSATRNARCVITAFSAGQMGNYSNIPAAFEAAFWVEGTWVAAISHQLLTEQRIPIRWRASLKGVGFEGRLSFDNQITGRFGALRLSAHVEALQQILLELNLKGRIKLNGAGTYSVQTASVLAQLFDLGIVAEVDYAAINPSAKQYDQEFNRHSKIILQDRLQGPSIAHVELGQKPAEDRFDFFLQFSEGSPQPLSNYLLSVQQLMKY